MQKGSEGLSFRKVQGGSKLLLKVEGSLQVAGSSYGRAF
jgi:hypothetical protein